MNEILKDANLLKKYDVYAFDYIEYPHKSFWKPGLTDADFRAVLTKRLRENPDAPLMLYVHIPFCEQLCLFCLCHKEITRDYDKVTSYLDKALFKEIELFVRLFDEIGVRPKIGEIYFGGGSPTILHEKEFDRLCDKLRLLGDIDKASSFNVEIDPRRVDEERLLFYASRGVNKLSFGVQDFDPQVQAAINRVQPAEMVYKLLTPAVRSAFPSINFDMLVGLPQQTIESIAGTIDHVVAMAPDRVSLAYMHYGPQYHSHLVQMNRKGLVPDFYERKQLFVTALERLAASDYVRTGFEHFAKPRDPVAAAVAKGQAYYNSFGATTGECSDILALGRASYSTIGDEYYQWVYDQAKYESEVAAGRFPIYRGFKLSADDSLRRQLVKDLRTFFRIDVKAVERQHGLRFFEYFARELPTLIEFCADEILTMSEESIVLTEKGKHFANLAGSIFDNNVDKPRFRKEIATERKGESQVPASLRARVAPAAPLPERARKTLSVVQS